MHAYFLNRYNILDYGATLFKFYTLRSNVSTSPFSIDRATTITKYWR